MQRSTIGNVLTLNQILVDISHWTLILFVLSEQPLDEVALLEDAIPDLVPHSLVFRVTRLPSGLSNRRNHLAGFRDRHILVGISMERPNRNLAHRFGNLWISAAA